MQRRLGLGPLGVGSDGGHRARGVEEGGSSAPRGGVPGGVAATAATYATDPQYIQSLDGGLQFNNFRISVQDQTGLAVVLCISCDKEYSCSGCRRPLQNFNLN